MSREVAPSSPSSLPGGRVALGALRKLFVALEALGVDVEAVRREIELSPDELAVDTGFVPVATLHRAWAAADRRLDRPDAALFVAGHYSPGDYGLLGFVAMTAGDLRGGLESLARYAPLWVEEPRMIMTGDGIALRWTDGPPAEPAARFADEATLAEILHAARRLTGRCDLAPAYVTFPHAAPRDASAHARFFRCPVRFGAAETRMVFDAVALAAPFPTSDPRLVAFLRDKAAEELATRELRSAPHERVKELIGQELPRGLPPIERIARRLATSERTLRRRLEAEGTSFRELLDETRRELAERYMLDRERSLAEIANLVGFSETSAFTRAFKRWTGKPPAAWRTSATAQVQLAASA